MEWNSCRVVRGAILQPEGSPVKKILCTLAFCFITLVAAPIARATQFSIDYSDLWWNPNESGWGLQVVQTGSVLFVTMFVYDQNNYPTWYSATANYQGNLVWTGDLLQSSGPWLAAVPFNPGAVSRNKVGTLTFAPSTQTSVSGTVTYSVNGAVVTKAIQRITLTFDSFGGTYQGMFKQVLTCTNAAQNGTFDVPATLTIGHAGGTAFTMIWTGQSATCTYSGTYGQDGRFGHVSGTGYTCTDGTAGTFFIYEMYVNIAGFLGMRIISKSELLGELPFWWHSRVAHSFRS